MNALVLASMLVFSSTPSPPEQEVVDPHAVDAICGSPFGSNQAGVRVYRDDDGDVTALELEPDPERFEDPPTTIFAPGGRARLVIVRHELPPGPDADALAKATAEAFDGGAPAESLSCRVEPRAIHQLADAEPGRYLIEGYVAHIYHCSPRANVTMGSCTRDHVALSEMKRTEAGLWPLGKTEVLALTGNLMPFPGSRYRMRVAITGQPSMHKHTNPDVEVLALTPARR